jgi:hypothetical protein
MAIMLRSSSFFSPCAGKPVLESSDNGSLTVVWSKPTRVGRSPLRGYQVEYYLYQSEQTTSNHWNIAEVQVERYRLRGLSSAATNVVFLVRARNEHGLSPPSLLSERLSTGGASGGTGGEEGETEEERGEVKRRLGSSKLVEWRPMEAVSSTEVVLHWNVSEVQYSEAVCCLNLINEVNLVA